MGKLYIAIILAYLSFLSHSIAQEEAPGDTIGPFVIIDFESTYDHIGIDTSENNIWNIGKPQKQFFDSAYSSPHAIVTDTILLYPDNNHSYFDLYLDDIVYQGWYPYDIWIDFMHKYDTDSLMDGGYITISYDEGISWINIIDDTCWHFDVCPPDESSNLYSKDDTLSNGESGFSGNSGGWIKTGLAWYIMPVFEGMEVPEDTMILRFNFFSDSIPSNKEGWMIDHIKLYAIDLGGGANEFSGENQQIFLYPNPCMDYINIEGVNALTGFQVFDPMGHIVMEGSIDSDRINVEGLPSGLYILELKTKTQAYTSKIIKR